MQPQKSLKLFTLIQVFYFRIILSHPCSTQTNSTTTPSILCSKNELWSNETSSCQKVYARGQCPELMTFAPNLDDPSGLYGVCMCDNFRSAISDNICAYRPKIYWADKKRCYKLFTQGPCTEGEWLTLLQSKGQLDQFKCQPNPCQRFEPYDENDESFWFSFGGICYLTGTQGFCRENTLRIYIEKNGLSPLCLKNKNCI